MSTLLMLVKILSGLYQSKKVNDVSLIEELANTYKTVTSNTSNLFPQDKLAESGVRSTIDWLLEQTDEPVIRSMLMQRVMDFTKDAPELKESISNGLEDFPSEERTRQVAYKQVVEIRKAIKEEEFTKEFKTKVKDFYFGDIGRITKDQWSALADLIEKKMYESLDGEKEQEVIESVNSEDINGIAAIIERAKIESSPEGVLKTGFQGLNKALYPDLGFRRAKFYVFYGLTNRGKSLTIGHMAASIGLYNTPKLRDPTKIPTIVLDSAEDALDLIITRLYKLMSINESGVEPDFKNLSSEDIANTIVKGFKANGWHLILNRINPSEDTLLSATNRIRKLKMKGYEVIAWLYDYLGLMSLKGMAGDTKSDKLADLHRRKRTFCVNEGIAYITCGQLNPDAKKLMYGADDDTELNFAKDVGGKSMTDGSTKITNEVDGEITVHVAKLGNGNCYWTFYLGKMRGEMCDMSDRFGMYKLHPTNGLMHDINGKNQCLKSANHVLNENGENVDIFE